MEMGHWGTVAVKGNGQIVLKESGEEKRRNEQEERQRHSRLKVEDPRDGLRCKPWRTV